MSGTRPWEAADQQSQGNAPVFHLYLGHSEAQASTFYRKAGASEGQTLLLLIFIPVITSPMSTPLKYSVNIHQPQLTLDWKARLSLLIIQQVSGIESLANPLFLEALVFKADLTLRWIMNCYLQLWQLLRRMVILNGSSPWIHTVLLDLCI